jgi:hypothetical protein
MFGGFGGQMEPPLLFSAKYSDLLDFPVWRYVMFVLRTSLPPFDDRIVGAILQVERLRTFIRHAIIEIDDQDYDSAVLMLNVALRDS